MGDFYDVFLVMRGCYEVFLGNAVLLRRLFGNAVFLRRFFGNAVLLRCFFGYGWLVAGLTLVGNRLFLLNKFDFFIKGVVSTRKEVMSSLSFDPLHRSQQIQLIEHQRVYESYRCYLATISPQFIVPVIKTEITNSYTPAQIIFMKHALSLLQTDAQWKKFLVKRIDLDFAPGKEHYKSILIAIKDFLSHL